MNPDISHSQILTRDVVASLLRQKKNKRVKDSTLETYQKRLNLFERKYPVLPTKLDLILDYLSRFDGESGRHRLNHQDLLSMRYTHAVRYFDLSDNPVAGLKDSK